MRLSWRRLCTFLFFWTMLSNIECFFGDDRNFDFVVEYFNLKRVRMMTIARCRGYEPGVELHKKFSNMKVALNWLDLRSLKEVEVVEMLTSKFVRIGVLLNLKCPQSLELLKMANKNLLFSESHSLTFWLVLTETPVRALETVAKQDVPHFEDPLKFLLEPYNCNKNSAHLMKANRRINAKFIKSWKSPGRQKEEGRKNKTEIEEVLSLKLLLDNELVMASGNGTGLGYRLTRFYRPTVYSSLRKEELGKYASEGWNLEKSESRIIRRRNLNDGLLFAVSAILHPEVFSDMYDLRMREFDIWTKLMYHHVCLLAEDLNFRLVIRFYDDFGWHSNGTFDKLIGSLQQKKGELTAGGLLMRSDRMNVVDFAYCPFQLQTAILLKEPSLSSIRNIFILPFSTEIWLSFWVVIILTVAALRLRAMAGGRLVPPDENISNFMDIHDGIIGVLSQQGFPAEPKSLSARISVITFLLMALALSTSYSACIVALIQSSSSDIGSVADITESKMEVGIQDDFPYFKVLIKEEVHPVIQEFYKKKVLSQGEKAFYELKKGIEKVRTGMFALEADLITSYKLINEIYEEREKCGVIEIPLNPNPFVCVATRKGSPYMEFFAERLVRQSETGLFDRSWKLWVDRMQQCEMSRIGFISVGLTEFQPPLMSFVCGVAVSLLIFLLEILYNRRVRCMSLKPTFLL